MVSNYSLFYPMLALFLWSIAVLTITISIRIVEMTKGKLTNKYFELFQGNTPSDSVLKSTNNLRNLTEFPPLFYVISLLIIFADKSDQLFLTLAWVYFIARVAHSLVHLTINYVPARFVFYLISTLLLVGMWLRFALLI